ncbi:MAG: TIM barrel protein [Armatimonadetes bacterium]|nr:TIM barrel protein [Armatimonadota bacterium]
MIETATQKETVETTTQTESTLKLKLGINCGFAINRFPEPEVWARIVGETLGLRYCQFVADLLNPFWDKEVIADQVARVKEATQRYQVTIETTFTSAFTRVNHLLHPDPLMRRMWFKWFERFFKLSKEFGAIGSGSHFGIMSVSECKDPKKHTERLKEGVRLWQELTKVASDCGLKFLMFEPMSIPREMGETIEKARMLYEAVNEKAAVPFLMCLDVDHGDVLSEDPRDTDPYAWLEEFGSISPVVHIKQSLQDKGGHWPFTEEYNRNGKVHPKLVIDALKRSGAKEVTLTLEISHRERRPYEDRVLNDLIESVRYWRDYVKE